MVGKFPQQICRDGRKKSEIHDHKNTHIFFIRNPFIRKPDAEETSSTETKNHKKRNYIF